MHALSVSLLRAKQLPVITNGLGASPHAGSTCTIGVVTVRPLNRLPARLYFKLKPDPNNTFFFIFTCTTQYPWVLANLSLSQAMAPSKKKRTHTVFRDSSAHRSASTSKPRFVGERVKLGDVLQVVNGKNQKAVKDENGQYPIYGSGGQMGWASSCICPADTFIIGRKGNINKPIYVSEPFWNVDTAFGLVAKPELLDARYLYHFCKHYDFGKLNTTCTIPSLTRKNIEGILLRLPSLGGQKETAAQLDSILKQIALAQQEIAGLDSLVKSRFVEMFGDPVDGVLWAKQKLSDLYQVKSSKRIYAREQTKSGVPFLRLADVGSLIDSGMADSGLFISEERFEELKVRGHVPAPDDVLVTARGTLGRCYVIKPADHFYFQDGMITWLAASENSPLPSYLLAIFDNPHFIEQLSNNCSGTTVRYLSISDLANVTIPVAPLALQEEFASFASQVDKSGFATHCDHPRASY